MKEAILWIFILLPFIYLLMIWDKLPETVPTHFNIEGEADDWSHKTMLIYLPCMLGIGIYLLMLVIPSIDPKKRIAEMGEKFYMIRFITVVFMSVLSLYILYTTQTGSMTGINFFLLITCKNACNNLRALVYVSLSCKLSITIKYVSNVTTFQCVIYLIDLISEYPWMSISDAGAQPFLKNDLFHGSKSRVYA